jgi:hypothetical protein
MAEGALQAALLGLEASVPTARGSLEGHGTGITRRMGSPDAAQTESQRVGKLTET